MALVWQYGDKPGYEAWKGLSWGMVCLFFLLNYLRPFFLLYYYFFVSLYFFDCCRYLYLVEHFVLALGISFITLTPLR